MEIPIITFELIAILFAIAILAGLLDTLAGGGGLITIPALILSGVGPLTALGTNKLQGSMGTATATYIMLRSKRVKWREVRSLMLIAFLTAGLGSLAVQFIDSAMLSYIIPVVISFIGVYFLLSPTPSQNIEKSDKPKRYYKKIVVPGIGFYDGFFGPGTGSFFTLAGVSLKGGDIINATAVAKTLNFATNAASLIVFLLAGKIAWLIGLAMMLGQAIGAWLGCHCLFNINPKLLRVLIVVMCFAMLIKYSYEMNWLAF